MNQFLLNREIGSHPTRTLCRVVSTNRWSNLRLSQENIIHKPQNVFGPSCGVNSLAFDACEFRYLLVGNSDCGIVLYDVEEKINSRGKIAAEPLNFVNRGNNFAHKFSVQTVSWYPHDTGMFFSSSMDHKLKVWDTNTFQVACEFDLNYPIYSHSISMISTTHLLIANATKDSLIYFVDLRSGSSVQRLKGHTDTVLSVCWSPSDEYLLASGGNDGNLFLWDIRSSGRYLHSFQQNNTKNSISLAHHFRGKKSPFVLSAARKSTLKYSKSDPSNGLCEAHPRGVNGIQFTPDGLFLLSTGRDSRLRMWDVMKGTDSLVHFAGVKNTRKMNVQFSLAVDSTPDLVFHPCLNSVGCYVVQTGELLGKLEGHYRPVNCCLCHPSSQKLFTGSRDGQILVYDSPKESIHRARIQIPNQSFHSGPQEEDPFGDEWDEFDD